MKFYTQKNVHVVKIAKNMGLMIVTPEKKWQQHVEVDPIDFARFCAALGPELCKLHLFDAADDVVEASATYDSEKDMVNLYFAMDDLGLGYPELHVSESEFENMLDLANLADFEGGRMVKMYEDGEDSVDLPYNVLDFVTEFGDCKKTITKLLPIAMALHPEAFELEVAGILLAKECRAIGVNAA